MLRAPFNAGDEQARQAAESYTRQLTALLTEGRRGDAVALAMTTWGAPAEAVAGMRQTPIGPLFESVAPTLAYDNAIMGDGSVPTERLASITVPALVIDSGASPVFLQNAALAVAHALPNAQHRTLEGQTHVVAPEVLAPVLVEFFKATRVACRDTETKHNLAKVTMKAMESPFPLTRKRERAYSLVCYAEGESI